MLLIGKGAQAMLGEQPTTPVERELTTSIHRRRIDSSSTIEAGEWPAEALAITEPGKNASASRAIAE
jgi:hypothetical protein